MTSSEKARDEVEGKGKQAPLNGDFFVGKQTNIAFPKKSGKANERTFYSQSLLGIVSTKQHERGSFVAFKCTLFSVLLLQERERERESFSYL